MPTIAERFYGTQEQTRQVSPFIRRRQKAMEVLLAQGISAGMAVFITSQQVDDEDLDAIPKSGPVCDVYAEVATRCIAERTHRLSTPEEIARFKSEQRHREQVCAEITSNDPNKPLNASTLAGALREATAANVQPDPQANGPIQPPVANKEKK